MKAEKGLTSWRRRISTPHTRPSPPGEGRGEGLRDRGEPTIPWSWDTTRYSRSIIVDPGDARGGPDGVAVEGPGEMLLLASPRDPGASRAWIPADECKCTCRVVPGP